MGGGVEKNTIRKVSELVLSSVLKKKHTQLSIGNCIFILHVTKVFKKYIINEFKWTFNYLCISIWYILKKNLKNQTI